MGAFLSRPIEGDWPYLWIDATYVKAREAGSIQSVAVIVAVAVNTEGQRKVIGMKTGPSEAEAFWTDFLRSLMRRGLRGVKLVISDAHEGLKAAAAKVLKADLAALPGALHAQRSGLCQQDPAPHGQRGHRHRLRPRESAKEAHQQWRVIADQFRPTLPKLAKMMDGAEHEVLSYMAFPRAHWTADPLAPTRWRRLNAEIKRRTSVVGIFPNDASITRLVGAMLLEQSDEWSLNRRYMQLEGLQSLSDTPPTRGSAIQR